ncbi:signal peptidase I [Paenibacillus sp. y28]|uniref:signal peptidase I n=1 Tax=Paenibacillus sp. y28 TaxID=3129110 RepID=UPI00301ACF66
MKLLKELGGWVGTFAISLLLVVVIGAFVFQPTKVLGHSMDPTLQDSERIYISKISHTLDQVPEYGDIVIIDSRVDRNRTIADDLMDSSPLNLFNASDRHVWVKRVIGKPGDTIEIRSNKVYRNGEELQEPYINEAMANNSERTWIVPEDYIFVMGDNRNHSSDSRAIGPVPVSHVLGKKL